MEYYEILVVNISNSRSQNNCYSVIGLQNTSTTKHISDNYISEASHKCMNIYRSQAIRQKSFEVLGPLTIIPYSDILSF